MTTKPTKPCGHYRETMPRQWDTHDFHTGRCQVMIPVSPANPANAAHGFDLCRCEGCEGKGVQE